MKNDLIKSYSKIQNKIITHIKTKAKSKSSYKHGTEIHHLVAKKANNAAIAASILNKTINKGVENPNNKVRISTALHKVLHTDLYYGWANSVIIALYNAALGQKSIQIVNVFTSFNILAKYVKALDGMLK